MTVSDTSILTFVDWAIVIACGFALGASLGWAWAVARGW